MIIYDDLVRLSNLINKLALEWRTNCTTNKEFCQSTPIFVDYVKENCGIDCMGFYVKETGNITLTRCGIIDSEKFIYFLLRYE